MFRKRPATQAGADGAEARRGSCQGREVESNLDKTQFGIDKPSFPYRV